MDPQPSGPVYPFVDDGLLRGLRGLQEDEEYNSHFKPPTFPNPFIRHHSNDWPGFPYDAPRAFVEMRMCELSSKLREKPQWWESINDEGIVDRWRREANELEAILKLGSHRLSPSMINYVLAELHGYAALRDPETGIEVGSFERIWRSDSLIPPNLRESLLTAAELLERSPSNYRLRSDDKVLHLVDPSLYPFIYENPPGPFQNEAGALFENGMEDLPVEGANVSKELTWLPSEFFVKADGTVSLASPYISNLDPVKHGSAYPVVESLVRAAVPMWERVLSDLERPLAPLRLQTASCYRENTVVEGIGCIWGDGQEPIAPEELSLAGFDAADAWVRRQARSLPKALESYDGALEKAARDTVNLKDQTIRVFVQLANVVLKPGEEYKGAHWYELAGTESEMIVTSFIYYYDEENLEASELAFSARVDSILCHHGRGEDRICLETIYHPDGIYMDSQERGSVTTGQHRCIAFPNVYRHWVSRLRLADPTKPGHRKTAVLHLVDPSDPGLSTSQVPPAEMDWYTEAIYTCPALEVLPVEIKREICGWLECEKITRRDAEQIRKSLMQPAVLLH